MEFFEHFSFQESITCFLVLFAVIDIIGAVPVLVALRKKFGKIDSEKAAIVVGVLLITFLFLGDKLLKFINVDVNSFAIAGAFVMFIIGLEMILGVDIHKPGKVNSASIVPIAFPLIAGAGSLTTTLSLRAQYSPVNIVIGILINVVVVYIVLKSSDWLERKLGEAALMVLQKVFGIILLAMAIGMFVPNLVGLVVKTSAILQK